MYSNPLGAPPDVAPQPQPAVVRLPIPATRPLCTRVMLGVLVLVWLATTALGFLAGYGFMGSQAIPVLVRMGAKVNSLIAQGEYWRLFTANFLHIGLLHLGFNSYALLIFGTDMERRYGHARFLTLYLIAGLGGSVLSFIGNEAISAGASGAIFGLLGAMIAFFRTYRNELGSYGRQRLRSLLLVAGFNLVMGFSMPGIDNLGHIGGLLVGLALGWAYCPRYEVVAGRAGGPPRLVDRYEPARGVAISSLVLALLAALVLLRVHSGV